MDKIIKHTKENCINCGMTTERGIEFCSIYKAEWAEKLKEMDKKDKENHV